MQDTEDECLCVSENFSMCAPVVYHIVEHLSTLISLTKQAKEVHFFAGG